MKALFFTLSRNLAFYMGALAILAGCSHQTLASVITRSDRDIWVQYQTSAYPQAAAQAYSLAKRHCQSKDLRTYPADQTETLNDLTYRRYICAKPPNS